MQRMTDKNTTIMALRYGIAHVQGDLESETYSSKEIAEYERQCGAMQRLHKKLTGQRWQC